jgi:hypothetical protein
MDIKSRMKQLAEELQLPVETLEKEWNKSACQDVGFNIFCAVAREVYKSLNSKPQEDRMDIKLKMEQLSQELQLPIEGLKEEWNKPKWKDGNFNDFAKEMRELKGVMNWTLGMMLSTINDDEE